jgi:hypothetical protein
LTRIVQRLCSRFNAKEVQGGLEMLNWPCVNDNVPQHFPGRRELHDICKALASTRLRAQLAIISHHHLRIWRLSPWAQSPVPLNQTDGQLQHSIEFYSPSHPRPAGKLPFARRQERRSPLALDGDGPRDGAAHDGMVWFERFQFSCTFCPSEMSFTIFGLLEGYE